jgi:uncharacterized protein (UPF0333 family)
MECDFMKKGQISFEFIMLLLVLLFFLITVINPIAETATTSIQDVSRVSQAVNAGKKLSSAINYVASAGDGTTQIINLFLPKKTKIEINETELKVIIQTESDAGLIENCSAEEDVWKCTKIIPLITSPETGFINLDAFFEAKSMNFKVVKECIDECKVKLVSE